VTVDLATKRLRFPCSRGRCAGACGWTAHSGHLRFFIRYL